jgi:hypothetical protein
MKVSAMIVRAGLAPLNMTGRGYSDWVCAATDLGGGPVAIWSIVKLDRDRWLIPGLQVTLNVDPKRVGKVRCFTVERSSVPPIRDLVAANDPTVADPRGGRTAARMALVEAAETKPTMATLFGPGQVGHQPQSGHEYKIDSWTAGCDEAIAGLGSMPAPPEMVRGVAIVAAMRMMLRDVSRDLRTGRPNPESGSGGQYRRSLHGNETVLSINVAGRGPWATFVKDFKAPNDKPADRLPAFYHWLPVAVSADGSGPVQVLWDEVVSSQQQIRDIQAEAFRQQAATLERMRGNRAAAQQQPPIGTGGGGLPPQAHEAAARFADSLRGMPPGPYQAAIGQAIAGLNTVPPELRSSYLELWRSYGIPV